MKLICSQSTSFPNSLAFLLSELTSLIFVKLTLWFAVSICPLSFSVLFLLGSPRTDPNTISFYSPAHMVASVTSTVFDKKKLSTASNLLLQTDTWSRFAVRYSLRLLLTFWGAFREIFRKCVTFGKTPAKYISVKR